MSHPNDREWTLRPLLLAAIMALVSIIPASRNFNATLATKPGEWRTFVLEDGTVARLGPRTVLSYSFSHQRRSISVNDGEAWFKVKKDPQRPFVVVTPVGCAKALGTIFSVRHQLRSTSVTTEEGIVAAARLDDSDPSCTRNSIRLFAGQKAVIESWTPLVARAVDTEIEHAWTKREIVFSGQTVEQALAEFNRRNWVQLDMPADAEIVPMHVYGRFRLDVPQQFSRYLDKQLRSRKEHRS